MMARKSNYKGVIRKHAGRQAEAWPTYLGMFPIKLLAARAVTKHRNIPLKELRGVPGIKASTTMRPTRIHNYVHPHKSGCEHSENNSTVGWAPSSANAVALAVNISTWPAYSSALRRRSKCV